MYVTSLDVHDFSGHLQLTPRSLLDAYTHFDNV